MDPNLIPINCYVDDRGFLWQIHGKGLLPFEVRRVYIVGNFSKGTIRGLHYHKKEWKGFFVVKGSVKFLTIPYGESTPKTFVLSDKNPRILVVPPMNANGWMSLEDDTILIGMSNFILVQSKEDDIRYDPMEPWDVCDLTHRWKVKAR